MRVALGAVLLSLALPGAAGGQSFSVPAQLREPQLASDRMAGNEGPALAGDRVLWWEVRAGTAVLVSARAGEVRTGLVNINETTNYWENHLPFGGRAGSDSGSGRVGGRHSLELLTELQTVVIGAG